MNESLIFEQLLTGWEEVYKKGQLTLWVLLAVRDTPRHMKDIKDFIGLHTKETFTVDDNSVYRALKRYERAGLVQHELVPGDGGPERKAYSLTTLGLQLLQSFIDRNIVGVLYDPAVQKIITGEHGNV